MNRNGRYLRLLKQSGFGINLPREAISNFIRVKTGKINGFLGGKYPSPPMLSIIAAGRCNLKCSFCVCAGFPDDWEEYELTPEKFEKILSLDAVKKTMLICFTGGEPLLNKDLSLLMQMARKEKHLVGMISNGLLLEEKAEALVQAGLCDAQISIYEQTKEKLKNIFPKVTKLLDINASYVLQKSALADALKDDFNSLIEIIKMCQETGCKSLKFNICIPSLGSNDFSENIYIDDNIYISFINTCKRKLKEINFDGFGCKSPKLSNRFTVFFPSPNERESVSRECRTSWRTMLVDANGNYGICCRLTPKANKYGNIIKDMENALNSEKARRIREPLINNSLPLAPECNQCANLTGSYGSKL